MDWCISKPLETDWCNFVPCSQEVSGLPPASLQHSHCQPQSQFAAPPPLPTCDWCNRCQSMDVRLCMIFNSVPTEVVKYLLTERQEDRRYIVKLTIMLFNCVIEGTAVEGKVRVVALPFPAHQKFFHQGKNLPKGWYSIWWESLVDWISILWKTSVNARKCKWNVNARQWCSWHQQHVANLAQTAWLCSMESSSWCDFQIAQVSLAQSVDQQSKERGW